MTTRRFICATVVALALAVGCSSDSKPATSSTSSATSKSGTTDSTSTASATTDQDAAKAAYLAYWQMFDRVTNPPNPSDPAIAQYSVDPARADLIDIVKTAQAEGQRFARPDVAPNRHSISIDSIDATTAQFTDCYIDDGIVLDATTGSTINDNVVSKLLKGRMVFDAGQWKVAQYDTVQRRDGASGCAS